ncbi:lytic transglycosylase domain-containing protein [uncultured Paracoccus sp.]|uniref:lytic transglycosylase domain-containing protein n=1 Tax=uncultured Paracoccus sp. TaxID=189685 RepID=UPI0025E9687E|nr:lytic transglycosylase domain-containing protein [uncultured Paracoccus sp.]
MRRFLAVLLALLIAPIQVSALEAEPAIAAIPAPPAKPARAADDDRRRCTADGVSCISLDSYVPDVCRMIESASASHGIDPHFLARLLWKESLFEPGAISPAGALGIAQFMPGTAQIVGLDDPFNPAKSIEASARYLRQLTDGFGNIGMAAVAYNGGENRAARFRENGGRLPWETLDYVQAITGHTAEDWRENPPAADKLDLRLDPKAEFLPACITLAANRRIREFQTPQRAWPWGVIVASHPSQSGAAQQVSRLNRQLRPILGSKRVDFVQRRLNGNARRVYTAQVGYETRREALTFCNRLRNLGGRCLVLRN